MFVLVAQKTYFGGPDVVGQTDDGSKVVGCHQVVGNEHGVGDEMVEVLCGYAFEKVV